MPESTTSALESPASAPPSVVSTVESVPASGPASEFIIMVVASVLPDEASLVSIASGPASSGLGEPSPLLDEQAAAPQITPDTQANAIRFLIDKSLGLAPWGPLPRRMPRVRL